MGDEPIGPGQGVEVLVPELALRRGLKATLADARIGRVEQGQRPNPLRTVKGEGLGDRCADVVSGHHHLGDPQSIEEGDQVLGQDLGRVPIGREHVGLVRVAEAPEVGGDHVGDAGKQHEDAAPVVPEARPSVQEQDRLTLA